MASGSGKNQDDNETKEPVESLRQREESIAAAATEPLPSAPQLEIIPEEEEVHGPPEAGGENPSAATATATAAEQKGKETESLFWAAWDSPGDKPPLPPPRPPSFSRAGPPSFSRAGGTSAVFDLEDVFDELMLECKRERSGETDQKAEAEGTPRQQNEQVNSQALWPKKGKKPLWRKVLDRIGISNQNYTMPHVNYQKLHITELIRHFGLLEMVAGKGIELHPHALNLRCTYSEFRPVHGDGECFYRSFIFSYLEQVLHRQDTHEEHRLLAAVKGVARQHARLGWASEFSRSYKEASEFSRSYKAFKKLIKKVMRWKTHKRWKHVPTINSYRIGKLLEFFNDYKKTDDIFTFLRLVAAIWICSHSEDFVQLILDLNGRTLSEWCFQEVARRRVYADHIQITALVRALRVPLRVENLLHGAGQDLYNGQDPQDDMPRSTCWPRRHHQVPPNHEVPRVTVLYMQQHYDILYSYHPDGPVTSGESSGQRSDKIESQSDKSPSQHQTGSCSSETSNQQIDRVEGSTSTREKSESDNHTVERES